MKIRKRNKYNESCFKVFDYNCVVNKKRKIMWFYIFFLVIRIEVKNK